MALQAPAIVDVRPTGASTTFGMTTRLRGIGVRQVRLACGLVMFAYIFSHFFNHAIGNISYSAMETWLSYHIWWWRIPVVNFALYAAAATHAGLGLWALYLRRHFRYTVAEITQLALGLSIPLLIASHLGAERGSGLLFGLDPPNYAGTLLFYWIYRPHMIVVQFILLTVAWVHGCIGLYFWLRLKPFFKWASPYLLAVAVLLPPLAMLGAHQGARDVIRIASPQWRADHVRGIPPEQRSVLDRISLSYFPIGYIGLIGLVFAARGVRALRERRGGMITVTYPDRRVRVPKGLSVLEASLRFNVPHASVCGGRRDALPAAFALSAIVAHCRHRPVARRLCSPALAPAPIPQFGSRVNYARTLMWPSSPSCPRMWAPVLFAIDTVSISARSATSSACSSTCAARPSWPRPVCHSTSYS